MAKQQQFLYDYRDDHDGKNNGKLTTTAIVLLVISILLVAFSHFVLIKQKEKFKKEIPLLKENKQKLEKEVEALDGNIKHNEENNKKLARNAIILLVISILLFLFSHFVLIKQGEKFKQEIPSLKENKQKLEKEVEVLNGNIKHGEDSYKKVEALINKYK